MRKNLFAIFITLLTFAVFLWVAPLDRLPEIPRQIKLRGVLLGFIFYILSYVAVSLRWGVFFSEGMRKTGIRSRILLFLITAAHQFMANLLPARSGDPTIAYLAKRNLNVDASLAMSSLIIARTFDVMILGILTMFFIGLHRENSLVFHPAATAVAILFVSLPALGIVLCIFKGKKLADWLNGRVAAFFRRRRMARGEKIALFLSRTAHLLSLRKSNIFYAKCLSLTILIMLLRIAYLSMFALHAVNPIPLGAASLVGLSTLIVSATPIQGFLGLGAFEGGWVLGYVLSGLSPEEGLLTAAGAHLTIMIFILFSGMLSNLILEQTGGQSP